MQNCQQGSENVSLQVNILIAAQIPGFERNIVKFKFFFHPVCKYAVLMI
jgi:hypothetical protein